MHKKVISVTRKLYKFSTCFSYLPMFFHGNINWLCLTLNKMYDGCSTKVRILCFFFVFFCKRKQKITLIKIQIDFWILALPVIYDVWILALPLIYDRSDLKIVPATFFASFLRNKKKRFSPVDTGRKLNVHKTFRRRPGRLLNVLCTFNLRPVPTTLLHFKSSFRSQKDQMLEF